MANEPRLSLTEQIAQLSDGAFLDSAADHDHNLSFDGPPLDHYLEVGPSSLRQDVSLGGSKYHSTAVTRDTMYGEDSGHESEESGHESSSEHEDSHVHTHDGQDRNPSNHRENNPPPLPQSTTARPGISQGISAIPTDAPDNRTEAHDLASSIRASRDKDRQKGSAVANQLDIWDSLLDTRIRLQKAVMTPTLPGHTSLLGSPHSDALTKALHEASELFKELFALEKGMFGLADESLEHRTTNPLDELTQLSRIASARESSAHTELVQTLIKWSDKIRAVAPAVSHSSSFKKSQNQGVQDDLHGIMTMAQRSLDEFAAAVPPRPFDDTLFYQRLLRDVISSQDQKSGDSTSRQPMALHSAWLPSTKAKKPPIDTRASKGRKLRYEVHEKLQNFMAPTLVVKGGWHEEQIDDLFFSLSQITTTGL